MKPRLSVFGFNDSAELVKHVLDELEALSGRDPACWTQTQAPLIASCNHAYDSGARSAVIQRRVLDQDFIAEHNTYYSRQFAPISRYCHRIHFFGIDANTEDVLQYLDHENIRQSYIGFVTLRPAVRTPVGASIMRPGRSDIFVPCKDRFPVHLGGVSLPVEGTPFMQQDNAVGACAQASIWMALRTLRKREGDRAHDPAQITDAATRYILAGRTLPNRTGLTQTQIVEAIRAAGYSPHYIPLTPPNVSAGSGHRLDDHHLRKAMRTIHAYVESEIPVLLALYPKSGGHAVLVIGHTFSQEPVDQIERSLSLGRGLAVPVTHAASWIPKLVVHNDNTGPYLALEPRSTNGYALEHAFAAIPFLPADVFMSGEEAFENAMEIWNELLSGVVQNLNDEQTIAVASGIAVRLLLLEKKRIRAWAANTAAAPEVTDWLRIGDLPRRVWILELHQKDRYGDHQERNAASMIGMILLDPTADAASMAWLMAYVNFPAFTRNRAGSMILNDGKKLKVIKTTGTDAVKPFRDLGTY